MESADLHAYICTRCHGYAFAAEDVIHLNQQCPGKHDDELVEEYVLIPRSALGVIPRDALAEFASV